MTGPLRTVAPPLRQKLSQGWQICATPPNEIAQPQALGSDGWKAVDLLGSVAACERAGGRWSLDRPSPIGFDAQDWWYRTRFDLPDDKDHRTPLQLRFDGLATLAEVWLNGHSILRSDNMFVGHVVDLSPQWLRDRGNELAMVFRSLDHALAVRRPRPAWRVPMLEQQQLRWFRTSLLGRTPGWSPPAAPVGPWRDVWLESRDGLRVDARKWVVSVDAGVGVLDASFAIDVFRSIDGASLMLERQERSEKVELVRDPDGQWTGQLRLPDPALWWPHTHGEAALYRAWIAVRLGDEEWIHELGSIGFRTLSVDTSDGGFALHVNGVPVFCRGACWTPMDIVSLRNEPKSLDRLLTRVRHAGMNMLRITGAMVYEDAAFFDACDAHGILVWQDLMFANMDYPAHDEAFRASVDRELRQQMRSWQGRPSLAVVCGNSEVSQQAAMWGAGRESWSPSLFHEDFPALVAECLPGVPYWPSSSWGGAFPQQVDTGTTSYYGVSAYLRPLDDARRSGLRFATECLGFAHVPAPHTIERMPGGMALKVTHASWKARAPRDLTAGWDFEDVRDHYMAELFGVDPTRLRYAEHDRYLSLARATSGEVMAAAFGEWRRTGSNCGGALVWFLRDLWAGPGWGVLDDAGLPKPCFHALCRVLQPVVPLLIDEGNNGLVAHVVNEGATPLDCHLTLDAWRGDVSLARGQTEFTVPPRGTWMRNAAAMLDHFMDLSDAFRFGRRAHDVVVLTLRNRASEIVGQAFHFPGGMGLPLENDLGLSATARSRDDGCIEVDLMGRRFAVGVHFEAPGFAPDDEYFHLPPQQPKRVVFHPLAGTRTWRGVVLALNAAQPAAIGLREAEAS